MKITGTQTESEDIKQEDTLSGALYSLVRHAKNSKINTVSKRISQGFSRGHNNVLASTVSPRW